MSFLTGLTGTIIKVKEKHYLYVSSLFLLQLFSCMGRFSHSNIKHLLSTNKCSPLNLLYQCKNRPRSFDTFVSEKISLVPEFQFQTKISVEKTDQKRYLCRERSAGKVT